MSDKVEILDFMRAMMPEKQDRVVTDEELMKIYRSKSFRDVFDNAVREFLDEAEL